MARQRGYHDDDMPIQMPKLPQLPKFSLPLKALGGVGGWIALALVLAVVWIFYWWFIQRIEVGPGEILVLTRKVGAPLPPEADGQSVLYPALLQKLGQPPNSLKYQGILYEPKGEGRYFYDPFFWRREIFPATLLGKGEGVGAPDEIGIKVRKYGDPLPPGKIVATEPHERGPMAEVLQPGRYNLNPYAYEVKRVQPVFIPEGFVGVQTLYSGAEPADPNTFLAKSGERGVQPDVLPPGMYYNNPYVRRIDLIETRTQTLDLVGQDAIRFPSNDSFQIVVEATVQYAVRQDQAAYVLAAIGDHDDIATKLLLPVVRSFSRIEGSKLRARDFISGEERSHWQETVFQTISQQCYAQGIDVQQVLIRRIEPPGQIAGPISERQVAEQEVNRFRKEIDLAKSQAKFVEQEEMQKQAKALGEAQRDVVTVNTEAEQRRAVAITEARKRLEVSKLRLESAKQDAQAKISRGQAEAEIIRLRFEAEALPLRDAVNAFGGGDAYAQHFFYQKLAPSLKTILANTDGPFSDIFKALSPSSIPRGVRPVSTPTGGGNNTPASAPALSGGGR
ncbi:MAG: SPFH domain-containing protein [Phycisphaerae bacterium]|nr:SPFH domain-containing protein [Phycisphaerae bacterium]